MLVQTWMTPSASGGLIYGGVDFGKNYEMAQKVSHFRNKARDRDFEPFRMLAISISYA